MASAWLEAFRRRCSTHGWLVAFLCGFVLIQSLIVIGLQSSVVTSLEKRYGFSSFQAGCIIAMYDLVALILTAPLSYLGRNNKALALGCGLATFAVGCFMFALPKLVSDLYAPPVSGQDCSDNSDGSLSFGLLLLAQVIMGTGGSALYTLGPSVLDDCQEDKSKVPLYLGAFYAVGAAGPALGFMLGGVSLGMYVDPGNNIHDLGPDAPGWVGAWWLFFIVLAIVGAVFATPFVVVFADGRKSYQPISNAAPSRASSTRAQASQRESADAKSDAADAPSHKVPTRGDMIPSVELGERSPAPRVNSSNPAHTVSSPTLWESLCVVGTTPAIVFGACGQACEALLVAAGSTFFPKMLELQYALSAGTASMMAGGVVVVCASGGMLFGGFLMKHLQASPEQTAWWTFRIAFIAFCLTVVNLIGCEPSPIAGITTAYPLESAPPSSLQLGTACNGFGTHLNSSQTPALACSHVYEPVCGADGVTYINTCYAGCFTNEADKSEASQLARCACVLNNGSATNSACSPDCWGGTLPVYLLSLGALMFATFMNNAPASTVVLRSVSKEYRPVAMAAPYGFAKMFGVIPGPVLFGLVLDGTCTFITKQCSSDFCSVYDVPKTRMSFFLWAFGSKAASALFFFLSARTFVAVSDDDEEEEEEEGKAQAGASGSARTKPRMSRRQSQEALALELVAIAEGR